MKILLHSGTYTTRAGDFTAPVLLDGIDDNEGQRLIDLGRAMLEKDAPEPPTVVKFGKEADEPPAAKNKGGRPAKKAAETSEAGDDEEDEN